MVEICPKCSEKGYPYYSKAKGKSGKEYFNLYFRHIKQTDRKGKNLQTTCYVRSVSEEEYNNRPKKKSIIDSIETQQEPSYKLNLSSEDMDLLKKIEAKLLSARNKSQASLIRRIIDSIERG